MIVFMSRTMHPQSLPLTIGETVLKESDDLDILEVAFDVSEFVMCVCWLLKMTFEKHLRLVSREASQRLGILKPSWRVFHDRSPLISCYCGFVLPVLGYCSAGGCSATDIQLKLLYSVVSSASFLIGGVFECDIAHRLSVLDGVFCFLSPSICTHSLSVFCFLSIEIHCTFSISYKILLYFVCYYYYYYYYCILVGM